MSIRLVVLGAGILVPLVCFAQQLERPREALPMDPHDLNAPSATWVHSFGNIAPSGTLLEPGVDYVTDLAVVGYTRGFDLGPLFSAKAALSLPIGISRATATQVDGLTVTTFEEESKGVGDLELAISVGLTALHAAGERGIPAGPDLIIVGQLIGVAPTGAYRADQRVNLGDHRWGMRAAMPMIVAFGGEQHRTTFEVTPSVGIFSDHGDLREGETRSQTPLGRLETHVSQDLIHSLWISFDGVYLLGGETFLDGLREGNRFNTLAVGGTLGFALLRHLRIEAGYVHHVLQSSLGGRGGQLKVRASVEL